MPHERLKRLRERLKQRQERVRAKRENKRARSERDESDSAGERAAVAAKRAKERGQSVRREVSETRRQAGKLGADAKSLIATELGVSTSEAESVISQGAAALERARDAGALEALDADGDGDTDVLGMVDEPVDEETGGALDPTTPVFDVGERAEPDFDPVNVEEPIDEAFE